MKPLEGRVAVVAGATRGAGRGIARMLGDAGATVYCSGRSSRSQPNTSSHHYAGRPETIEETAELVDAAGGAGVPVRVDHTVDEEVAALFTRVQREHKRLDVLVNILTGQPVASWKSFWQLPLDESRAFVNGWIRPHIATCWHAAPLMVKHKSGLNNPEAKKWGFIASETPCFVGRPVAALAADVHVKRKTGGVYSSGALSEEYGFTDIDGNRPNMGRYMKEHFPHLVNGKPSTAVEWKIVAA